MEGMICEGEHNQNSHIEVEWTGGGLVYVKRMSD